MFFTVKEGQRIKAEAYIPEVIKALESNPMIREILKEFDKEFPHELVQIAPDYKESVCKKSDIRAFLEKSLKRVEGETIEKLASPYKRDSVEVIIRVIDGNDIEVVNKIIPLNEAYMSRHNILLRNCESAISDLSKGILSKCKWLE